MKFQLLIKLKCYNIDLLRLFLVSLLDVVYVMLISVKMPIIVGILTFMSMIKLYNLKAWLYLEVGK